MCVDIFLDSVGIEYAKIQISQEKYGPMLINIILTAITEMPD